MYTSVLCPQQIPNVELCRILVYNDYDNDSVILTDEGEVMKNNTEIQVGIGFATGRKNFKKVLNTYIYNWKECGLIEPQNVRLNLFVMYDLKYNETKATDFTNISDTLSDMVDDIYFLDKEYMSNEIRLLINENVLSETEANLFFGSGYASMRNTILFAAIKNKMDCLLFLDDDEYPVAVTKTHDTAIWSGQHVLKLHLQNIENADITNGHHCGYISPIPHIEFNDVLTENDFKMFIEAISNDIVNWECLKEVMNNGGLTYADKNILMNNTLEEVPEISNAKFISGANLCINLADPHRTSPFYNPPGARGEDTFLSTCLSDRKVLRLPCYTFHDGFSIYNHLLSGVLPTKLNRIEADSKRVISRFYRACIGWIRYKPLFLYITKRDDYNDEIEHMRRNLQITLPKFCSYFNSNDFMRISKELEIYHKNVEHHYKQFMDNQAIWTKICDQLLGS